MNNIKYFFKKFNFLKIMFSPLRPLKLKWYFGKIAMGTPYMLPRKWVKSPNKVDHFVAKPIKWFGIQVVGLGWKTKWEDIRFEWGPMISIVILNRQLVIMFIPSTNNPMHLDSYWEAWLYYNYRTDKSKSKKERTIQLFEQYSCTWLQYKGEETIRNDYYFSILRKKYLKLYKKWKQAPIV